MNKDEIRREVHERDHWTCVVCGKPSTQVAHRVPDGKLTTRLYGLRYIWHPVNLRAVCSLECNKRVQVRRHEWDDVISEVMEALLPK
jgi:5-methylcytosine-specific restriction endonuclease McrA